MQVAGGIGDALGRFYGVLQQHREQQKAKEAYEQWMAGNMQPSTATQSGGVDIESPLGGGSMQIPTFETQQPRMGPVDSNALASLYGAMAGVAPERAAPYLGLGRDLYGANTERERYGQQRADVLEDRDYSRRVATEDREYDRGVRAEDRGFAARGTVAGAMTGDRGKFDVSNPDAFVQWYLSGGGNLMDGLAARPEPINPLGVIQGKGGAFIPYQQGTTFGGTSVKSDIPLADPTLKYQGGGGGGMSPAEARGLTDAYAELQIVQQQLDLISQQEAQINAQLKDASTWEAPKLNKQLAFLALKKLKIQGKGMRLSSEIHTRESGQVVRPGGTQPEAPQNPWLGTPKR